MDEDESLTRVGDEPYPGDQSLGYRLYRSWFSGTSGVVLLYVLAIVLAVASIVSYTATGGGEASRLELVLVLSPALILFYLAMGRLGAQ